MFVYWGIGKNVRMTVYTHNVQYGHIEPYTQFFFLKLVNKKKCYLFCTVVQFHLARFFPQHERVFHFLASLLTFRSLPRGAVFDSRVSR